MAVFSRDDVAHDATHHLAPRIRRSNYVPAIGQYVVLCAWLLAGLAWAEEPATVPPAEVLAPVAAPADCQVFFAEGDQRLFDFITTRKAVDYSPWQGLPIRSIRQITLPIFNPDNPDENNALYRGVNYLHVPTRGHTVSKQLLIHPGEPLDADRIHESERILRGANYLYDAMILPAQACADGVDLLVVVRDIWTLQPTASFKRTGGENSTSIGISDDNLFGYGHGISLSYDKNAQRSGVVLGYSSRNLIDGHTQLQLGHAKNDDGYSNSASLVRPFYALDTRWSAGVSGAEDVLREVVEANGITTNDYQHTIRDGEVFFGLSPGLQQGTVHRWRFGITHEEDRFDLQDPAYSDPLPADRLLVYPWIEYQRLENNFLTTSNLSQLFRNEDINVGEGWRFRLGATSSVLGSTTDALVSELAYDNTMSMGTHHLLRNAAYAEIYWNEHAGDYENTLFGVTTNYDFFIDDNNRWHAMLGLDAGINLTQDNELTSGGDNNLRGYPSGWQRGDRRIVASVERRHFYNAHPLHLFRLGSAIFAEAGQTWDSTGVITQSDRVLTDIGVGLRINSSKARPNHVLHIDLAFPLTDRTEVDGFQLSIQASNSF